MRFAYLLTAALLAGSLTSTIADDAAPKKKKSGKHYPAGTWVWETDVEGAYLQSQLKLELNKKQLTGEYSDENVSLEIENPTFDGETITFTLEFDVDGTEVKADFSGVVDGDKLTGNTRVNINGNELELPVDGERRTTKRDVLGKWQLTAETPDGETFEPTVVLKLDKRNLVGTYEGDAAGNHDLQDVSLKDNVLSFMIAGDAADGSTFSAKFTGKPRGDRLRGKSEVVINGQEMTVKIRGRRVADKSE